MTDTTKLAEKAAKFLGCTPLTFEDVDALGLDTRAKHWDLITGPELSGLPYHTCKDSELVDVFFNRDETAPILAHLAKREMEKLGYSYSSGFNSISHRYQFKKDTEFNKGQDENEYISLWLAIEKTGVMG